MAEASSNTSTPDSRASMIKASSRLTEGDVSETPSPKPRTPPVSYRRNTEPEGQTTDDNNDDDETFSTLVEDIFGALDQFTFSSGKTIPLSKEKASKRRPRAALSERTNLFAADTVLSPPRSKSPAPVVLKSPTPVVDQALKEAQAEREAARQWASNLRSSVQKWVTAQKALIQCQAAELPAAQQSYSEALAKREATIAALEQELRDVLTHYRGVEKNLHEIIQDQQSRLKRLEEADPKLPFVQTFDNEPTLDVETITEAESITRETAPAMIQPTTKITAPLTTPESNDSSTPRQENIFRQRTPRSRRITDAGIEIVAYGNGSEKEIHPDGSLVIRHVNGDVQTEGLDGTVAYFYADSEVLQVAHPDGWVDWQFPNGQMERHWSDGRKMVQFADGTTLQMASESGAVEDVDDFSLFVEPPSGIAPWPLDV